MLIISFFEFLQGTAFNGIPKGLFGSPIPCLGLLKELGSGVKVDRAPSMLDPLLRAEEVQVNE